MYITKMLLGDDPHLSIHNEGAWDKPYAGQENGFSSFNDAGIECETGEFFYGLMRILKPSNVLETGTHWGIGASYIGAGLRDNGHGILDTIEFLPEIHLKAKNRIQRLGLLPYVTCHFGDVAKFEPTVKYDFILLDTEPQTRFAEFVRFFDHLDEGGYIFIHDLPRTMCQGNVNTDWPDMRSWPFGDLPDTMKAWENTKQIARFHFPTPRGLVGFYKRHKDDFIIK